MSTTIQFTDADGSRIEHVRDTGGVSYYKVRTHPLKLIKTGETLNVAVADEPGEETATELVAWLRASVARANGIPSSWVVGFDTESGLQGDVCVLQLCLGAHCLIVRARGKNKAPLHRWALRDLLSNEGSRYVFAGAELASDALNLAAVTNYAVRMHGGLDFTPRFARLALREGDTVGLRTIVDDVLTHKDGPAWVKDKTITCSDWATQRLTLQQIKYAALDAWASARIGSHSVGAAPSPRALAGEVFTLRGVSTRIIGLLVRVIDQAAALRAAQVRSHEVTVEGVEYDGDALRPRAFSIRMRDYDRRLRKGFPVTVVLSMRLSADLVKRPWAPHATPHGATAAELVAIPYNGPFRLADGKALDVRGKTAFIELNAGCGMTGADVYSSFANKKSVAVLTTNAQDRERTTELAENWAKEALRGHTVAAARAHGFPNDMLPSWPAPEAGTAPLGLRFALALLGGGERLPTAMLAGPSGMRNSRLRLATRSVAGGMAQPETTPRLVSAAIAELSAELPRQAAAAVGRAASGLNPAQHLALLAAHTQVLTGVRGPPGTGKTRVIAAMGASFAQRGDIGRVLILAPSNAATKRILESLIAAGVKDAALVVSREYFEEWHELAYADGDISECLVTPKTMGGGEGATLASFFTGGGDASRFSGDGRSRGGFSRRSDGRNSPASQLVQQQRSVEARPSRWTRYGPGGTAPPTPRIVIMSHGSFAMATLMSIGRPVEAQVARRQLPLAPPSPAASGGVLMAQSWGELVKRVVDFATLRAAIVDEVSQLWNGYLLHLCATLRLSAVSRLVLVGDEHQLPPSHGEAIGAASVFDSLLAHADVPVVELTTTYRLRGAVCDELSKRIYAGRLCSSRNASTDSQFWRVLSVGLTKLQASPNGRAYTREVAALRRMAPVTASTCTSVAWADVHGKEEVGDGGSMRNAEEATAAARLSVAARLALALATPRPVRGEPAPPAFRVIALTFYKEQQQAIESEIDDAMAHLLRDPALPESVMPRGAVRSAKLVTTTDGFQGQEAELVIVSTVRSRPALSDFMLDYRRCNVALSRASQAMLVIGSYNAISAASHKGSGAQTSASIAVGMSRGSLLTHLALRCATDGVVFQFDTASGDGAHGGGGNVVVAARPASRAGGVRFSLITAEEEDPRPPTHSTAAPLQHPPIPQHRPRSPQPPLPIPPSLPPSPSPAAATEQRQPHAVVAALRAALTMARAAGGNIFLTAAQLGQVLWQRGLHAALVGKLGMAVAALPGVECVQDPVYGQHRYRLVPRSNAAQQQQQQQQQQPASYNAVQQQQHHSLVADVKAQPKQSPAVLAALRAALAVARAADGDGFLTSAELGEILARQGVRAALRGKLGRVVEAMTGVECEMDYDYGQHRFRLAARAHVPPPSERQQPQRQRQEQQPEPSHEDNIIAAALFVLREDVEDGGDGWFTGQALGAPVRRRMEELGQRPYRTGTLFAILRGSDDFEWRDEGTSFAAVRAVPIEPQPPTQDDVLDAARAVLRDETDRMSLSRLGSLVAAELEERRLLHQPRGMLLQALQQAHDVSLYWERGVGDDICLVRLRQRRRRRR